MGTVWASIWASAWPRVRDSWQRVQRVPGGAFVAAPGSRFQDALLACQSAPCGRGPDARIGRVWSSLTHDTCAVLRSMTACPSNILAAQNLPTFLLDSALPPLGSPLSLTIPSSITWHDCPPPWLHPEFLGHYACIIL